MTIESIMENFTMCNSPVATGISIAPGKTMAEIATAILGGNPFVDEWGDITVIYGDGIQDVLSDIDEYGTACVDHYDEYGHTIVYVTMSDWQRRLK